MSRDTVVVILALLVTVAGFLLALLSFLVIFRGKRLPGDKGSTHEIEFRGARFRTTGVVTLLVVASVVMVLPFCMLVREEAPPSRGDNVAPSRAPAEAGLHIAGHVLDEKDRDIVGARITVRKVTDLKTGRDNVFVAERTSNRYGEFDFNPPLPFVEGEEFIIEASKEGRIEQSFRVKPPESVFFLSVLVRSEEGGAP